MAGIALKRKKSGDVKQQESQAPWEAVQPKTEAEGNPPPWAGAASPNPKKEEGEAKTEDGVKTEGEAGGGRRTRRGAKALASVGGESFLEEEKDISKEGREAIRKAVSAVRKARSTYMRSLSLDAPETERVWENEQAPRTLSMRSYAAIGFGDTGSDEPRMPSSSSAAASTGLGVYGLIDRGPGPVGSGTRCLVMHSPSQHEQRETQSATDRVRPGGILRVVSVDDGGGSARLRVRFTTPERYYAPGARVTTIRVGVDAVDWESLTPKQRRLI
jgi:hypothetical protein